MSSNPSDASFRHHVGDVSYVNTLESSISSANSPSIADILNILFAKIIYFVKLIFHLFFQRKFILHRLTGLSYLLQYFLAFYLYFKNYESFKSSFLIWSLPLTGLLQAIIAMYTFTFLSRTKRDAGYYSDRGTLSYPFVVENSFFASLLLFQWLYYSNKFYPLFTSSIIIDNLFVFLPYIPRQLWPKTSFRDSIYNSDKTKTQRNKKFFFIVTHITKWFYVWAKHYIGFFLNYIRFFNRVDTEEIYHIYLLLLFGAFATTISIFLHTLKFKGYLGPKLSFMIYMVSYLATFYSFIRIRNEFIVNIDLTIYVFIGLLLNFTKYQHAYQIFLMILFNAHRNKILPNDITKYLFLS
ncbi:unnamed protein product [Rotaria sp. Silwood1]|nr:unnamed protein product [Rotaria sp. Silwood1]CAF0908628.1 unnamed protein product [Rotaria sp. Silwood1]CAF3391065.1 unnamed protein product [Rotaria sp. Silwood1]CAF3392245.1 unnamed protein product [Rotaria sp. Silwood1]CAF3392754.1 unnamed protein product [Rotaria sp. Silwood1]